MGCEVICEGVENEGQLELLRELPSWCGKLAVLKPDPGMRDFYGADTAFLMGGGLFTVTPDLTANCARFAELVKA